MRRYAPLEERFWAKVQKSDHCWEWTGGVVTSGYGIIKIGQGRRSMSTHRLSWEMHFGAIPQGLEVCHHCDNRRCIRPDHLFLGTTRDNSLDAQQKGRLAIGSRNPQALLTESQVRVIRERLAAGEGPTAIGRQFGVGRAAIQAIRSARNWRGVE